MNVVNWWEPLILHAVIALLLCEVGFRLSLKTGEFETFWTCTQTLCTKNVRCRLFFCNPICWIFQREFEWTSEWAVFFLFTEMCRVLFNHHTRSPRSVVCFFLHNFFFLHIFYWTFTIYYLFGFVLLFVFCCRRAHTQSLAMPFYREANNTESEKKGTRESKPAEKHTRLGEIYVWMQTQIKIFVSCRKSKSLLHERKM